MDASLSTFLLGTACALWIVQADRRRDQRRRAALAIAERVMRRGLTPNCVAPVPGTEACAA
jgi:hypothetical protein